MMHTETTKTAAPQSNPANLDLLDLGAQVMAPVYRRADALFKRGRGSYLIDRDDRRYLDMTSGIGVTALGHDAREIVEALRDGTGIGLTHVSNLFHTEAPIRLAAELVEHSFADRVFFANSGSEAVEAAIKFARLHGGEARREIVYAQGSFHGRTLGALAATDRLEYKHPFGPLPAGFRRMPWGNEIGLERIGESTAAVLVEPVQGEGGIRVAPTRWLRALRKRCDQSGALLIFDEVQCGLGRTGRLWAHEHAGVRPDLMTLAKPLAGGLPIGAVLMTERVAENLYPGCHGSTFGGGPLVARVALSVFGRIRRPSFLESVRNKGRRLAWSLSHLRSPLILELRGSGLMLGVKVDADPLEVTQAALDEDLLVLPADDSVVRLLPPLTVSEDEIDLAVDRLQRALARVKGS
jgi:predicted acetylornithine/succinylornithine family transaminase